MRGQFLLGDDQFQVERDHFLLDDDQLLVERHHLLVVREQFLLGGHHFLLTHKHFSVNADHLLVTPHRKMVNHSQTPLPRRQRATVDATSTRIVDQMAGIHGHPPANLRGGYAPSRCGLLHAAAHMAAPAVRQCLRQGQCNA